jgi:hypothetical protein
VVIILVLLLRLVTVAIVIISLIHLFLLHSSLLLLLFLREFVESLGDFAYFEGVGTSEVVAIIFGAQGVYATFISSVYCHDSQRGWGLSKLWSLSRIATIVGFLDFHLDGLFVFSCCRIVSINGGSSFCRLFELLLKSFDFFFIREYNFLLGLGFLQ